MGSGTDQHAAPTVSTAGGRNPASGLALGWPLGRWVFPAAAVLTAVGTWAATLPLLSLPYQVWASTSAAWHESLWLVGAGILAVSALIGTALFTRGNPATLPMRPRVSVVAVAAHVVPLASWVTLGHLVGLAPLTIEAVRTATSGHLLLADALLGTVGPALLTAVGFTLGVLVRHWLVAPASAVLGLVLLGLPGYSGTRPVQLLQPVQQQQSAPRFVLSLPTTAFTVVAIAVTTTAAVLLAGYVLNRSSARPVLVAAWVCVPVVLAVVAFAWRPDTYRVAGGLPAVCDDADGAQICLHEAYSGSEDDVVEAVSAVRRAGAAPLLDHVTDVNLTGTGTPAVGTASISVNLGPFGPRDALQSTSETIADQVSEAAFLGSCLEPGVPISSYDRQSALRYQVLHVAGYDNLVDSFGGSNDSTATEALSGMDADQLTRLVTNNVAAIRDCRVTQAELTTR